MGGRGIVLLTILQIHPSQGVFFQRGRGICGYI